MSSSPTKTVNILCDLDGVLADFLSLALERLNHATDEPGGQLTPASYAVIGKFNMAEVYGISMNRFWEIIEHKDTFWCNIKPFPWARDLLTALSAFAPVTICTSPSLHKICAAQKTEWVMRHLGLPNESLMIGSRKYLMAKPGNVLIDDYPKNIEKFEAEGGKGILVPSNWNTNPLTFSKVLNTILGQLE